MYSCSTCHTSCSHVKVTCTCKTYRPNSICSHALVAAEKCGDLDCLLKWGVIRLSRTISLPLQRLKSNQVFWKKGQPSTTKPITKKNQCGDASDNLGIENIQHVGPHPSVCGSALPSQVRTGSTATNAPIVEEARHTLGVFPRNMQQPRIHSSFSWIHSGQNRLHSK